MTLFVEGKVGNIVANKTYDSGTQYEMVVGAEKFKTFVKTGEYTPSVGDEVSVDESRNDKGWKVFSVEQKGVPKPSPATTTTSKSTYKPYVKDAKTQATISYWASQERAIQKLDSVVRNNIALLAIGKKTGMTLSMLEHLTTVDGFMSQVAEMTRLDLDIVEDVENFKGTLPTFGDVPPEDE